MPMIRGGPNTSGYPLHRLLVWSAATGHVYGNSPSAPAAGGDVDGIVVPWHPDSLNPGSYFAPACPGETVPVEAAAAFAAGALLETTSDGRVQTRQTGHVAVMRALQASPGAGSIVGACFTSGR